MHTLNSQAIAYALDAVFQVKIIGYVGTYVTHSIYLNMNEMVQNQHHSILPTPPHTRIVPHRVTLQILNLFSTSWQVCDT